MGYRFFAPGENYGTVFPVGTFRDSKRKRRTNRWRFSEARKLALDQEKRDSDARCAECGTPPFRAYGDQLALRSWIKQYRKGLAAELKDYFRKNPQLRARSDDWFAKLTPELQGEIRYAWEQAELDGDHGIPLQHVADLEDAGNPKVPDDLRKFIVDGFVTLVCQPDNRGRNGLVETPERMRERYARWFFDGDIHAAQTTDPVRWELLNAAIKYYFADQKMSAD